MAAVYPGAVKDFGADVVNEVDTIDAAHVNDLRDEVEAIEAELGVNPSGASSTVKDRLDGLDAHASRHLSGGADAIKLDDLAAPDDNTDLNASATAHGLLPKLSNNSGQYLNGQGNWAAPSGAGDMLKSTYDTDDDGKVNSAESADAAPWSGITDKPLTFDPSTHASSHQSGGGDAIKLDDMAAPDDNTDLNASATAHGLMPKLPNDAGKFLNGAGSWVNKRTMIPVVFGDGENAIEAGWKVMVPVPDDLEIVSVVVLADASGSIVIDVKKADYSTWPTTSSIAASAKPTLSSAQKSIDSTLTDWTKNLSAGDILEFLVDSATTVKQVTVGLLCKWR